MAPADVASTVARRQAQLQPQHASDLLAASTVHDNLTLLDEVISAAERGDLLSAGVIASQIQ
ncbi:hypothetical protein [Granulicoccus sp. GXG6511]|uniref:hypothetical protein n=1 Tax=Granulicoccus sp. GXG6511 TaxID=3381351 RepID=UPI003D7EE057